MQLSDLTMKKQILFGQIWKRLKIIVVDLNHYELILLLMLPTPQTLKPTSPKSEKPSNPQAHKF